MEDWKSIEGFENYEISDFGRIRNISKGKYLNGWNNGNGYRRVTLYGKNGNRKKFYVHRLVASAFVERENEEQDQIDHRDQNKTNNHCSNLRWVSSKENNNNKTAEYVDEISDESTVVENYSKWKFEFLYFDSETDRFYYYNGLKYRVQPIYYTKSGNARVYATDVNNKQRAICYNKFKKELGLI